LLETVALARAASIDCLEPVRVLAWRSGSTQSSPYRATQARTARGKLVVDFAATDAF